MANIGLSGEIFGWIVVWILGMIGGMAIQKYAINSKEKRTKKSTYEALLPEVKVNQKQLEILTPENIDKLCKNEKINKVLKDVQTEDPKDILLKQETGFDRTIYSALADKIGLLDPKTRKNLVDYYAKLAFLEHRVKFINENILTKLFEELSKEGYFKTAEVTFEIGKELIKNLELIK